MKNIDAAKEGKKRLLAAFRAAGLRSGETSAPTPAVPYWHNVKKKIDPNLELYVTYDLIGFPAFAVADDAVAAREFSAAVDVWSKKSFDSKAVAEFVEKLESALDDAEFSVVFSGEMFNPDTGTYHLPMVVYDILF